MPTQDEDDLPGDDDYRQTYNFAPNSYGLVYRLDNPDYGTAGSQRSNHNQDHSHDDSSTQAPVEDNSSSDLKTTTSSASPKYKLQAMKWGLIPFWTKRTPDYTTTMRTINCRDDSLSTPSGMWNTMKQNKRCIVLAQGFYEWLKKPNPGPSSSASSTGSGKDVKIPHFVRRKDGQLMCFAGLFDRVRYEDAKEGGEPLYTYTIITTDSNKQLSFLHDRMPVILDNGSPELFTWLDNVGRPKWSDELQKLLKPYQGELECYPVSKEVGKVGNNSPSFIVPLDSVENKQNIMNFFGGARKAAKTEEVKREIKKEEDEVVEKGGEVKSEEGVKGVIKTEDVDVNEESNAPMPVPASSMSGIKRDRDEDDIKEEADEDTHLDKAAKSDETPSKAAAPINVHRRSRNAMSNHTLEKAAAKKTSPNKSAAAGTKKITSFFGK